MTDTNAPGAFATAVFMVVLAGGITLFGVWLGVKLTQRGTRNEDDRMNRRKEDVAKIAELIEGQKACLTAITDLRERMAGMEAVIRLAVPWLRDDTPRVH